MEVVTFSVLSAFVVQALCLLSYMFYRRYKSGSLAAKKMQEEEERRKIEEKKSKLEVKKNKKKKAPAPRKRVKPQEANESDTESYTMEDQLAQVIMKEEMMGRRMREEDVINMTAVNAKPTIKKFAPTQAQKAKNHKKSHNLPRDSVTEPDWESVSNRKHKKKIETTNPGENLFRFELDVEGGIAETPFCEIHFPGDAVSKPMIVELEIEKHKKFVDDTEEKVFLTPAVHFMTLGDPKLKRRFTLHLNTMRMMGRGWDGTVCGQIETRGCDGAWSALGRVEYVFGKPIQIVHDNLCSFRVVITRGQNGSITRTLSVSAYIQKSKLQNPNFHVINLCVSDKSAQSAFKVETSMQKNILKMPPRDCDVQFGSDLQFKIEPTKKFTPEDKEVFIRWTEICKANFNVRFLIRLTRNKTKDKNYEAEYRTIVYLSIAKVNATLTTTQEEYFHFYWIAGNVFAGRKNWRKNAVKQPKDKEEKSSEDDGFASGSDLASSEAEKNTQSSSFPSPNRSPIAPRVELIPTALPENIPVTKSEKKRRKKKAKQAADSAPLKATKNDQGLPQPPQTHDKDGFEIVQRTQKPRKNRETAASMSDPLPKTDRNPSRKSKTDHRTKDVTREQPAPPVTQVNPRESSATKSDQTVPSAPPSTTATKSNTSANATGATSRNQRVSKNTYTSRKNVQAASVTNGPTGARVPTVTYHSAKDANAKNFSKNHPDTRDRNAGTSVPSEARVPSTTSTDQNRSNQSRQGPNRRTFQTNYRKDPRNSPPKEIRPHQTQQRHQVNGPTQQFNNAAKSSIPNDTKQKNGVVHQKGDRRPQTGNNKPTNHSSGTLSPTRPRPPMKPKTEASASPESRTNYSRDNPKTSSFHSNPRSQYPAKSKTGAPRPDFRPKNPDHETAPKATPTSKMSSAGEAGPRLPKRNTGNDSERRLQPPSTSNERKAHSNDSGPRPSEKRGVATDRPESHVGDSGNKSAFSSLPSKDKRPRPRWNRRRGDGQSQVPVKN